MTAHASFIDHFVENTHVDNEHVPHENGGQAVSSTKGSLTDNDHTKGVPAVNTGIDNEYVPHENGGQTVLSKEVTQVSDPRGLG